MIDLSSTLFFKAKFEITAKQADFDLLWCIVCHIRNWMSSKWRKRGENIPTDNAIWSRWKLGNRITSQNDMVHFQSMCYQSESQGGSGLAKFMNPFPPKKVVPPGHG